MQSADMMKHINVLLLGVILFLGGCALGPDFLRPFNAASDGERQFINEAYQPDSELSDISLWWERIDDPLLDDYVEQLLNQNLQLMQAAERIVQADVRLTQSRGAFFPTLGTNNRAARTFTGGNSRIFNNSFETNLESAWQIDLFGSIRRSVEAADASALASVYDREALVHTLIAQLLDVRVEIATQKELLALAQKSAQNRKDILAIIERRYEMGASNTRPQDVLRAQNNLATAEADVHASERLLADAAYRMDVLLGQAPGTIDPSQSDFPMLAPPVDVPVCLPADLLDRRPDLKAAELRVKAANADIGVAIADLYPKLNLSGSLGFSGEETRNLLNAERLAGSIVASITSRIFEGGALRANIDLQKSEARELAAAYAENVLNAMREVETNLKATQELRGELEKANISADTLRRAEDISNQRYLRGIETLNDYLDAQQDYYLAQQNLVNVQATQWNARTALYLALGGDWFGVTPAIGCGDTQEDQNKEEQDNGEDNR